jgi:hypothetical protein
VKGKIDQAFAIGDRELFFGEESVEEKWENDGDAKETHSFKLLSYREGLYSIKGEHIL